MNIRIYKRLLRVAKIVHALKKHARKHGKEKRKGTTRTLYHIGKRPASPKPNSSYYTHRFPDMERIVFLTPSWISVFFYGLRGNVYQYNVPTAAIKEAVVKRYDGATEVVFSGEVWDKYDLSKTFVRKIEEGKAVSEFNKQHQGWTKDASDAINYNSDLKAKKAREKREKEEQEEKERELREERNQHRKPRWPSEFSWQYGTRKKRPQPETE